MNDEIKEPLEEAEAEQDDILAQAESMNRAAKDKEQKKKAARRADDDLIECQKALEAKTAEMAELNDKYLRLAAEYDNFRKRSAKEKDGIYADAYVDALTQILPILDNLERAAMYRTDDSAETPLGKGLELTLKSFAETLSKLGVSEIEAQGKPFDPNVHNAVMHIEDESFGENEVVEVLMKGYIRGDKVLRYAMVKVAN